MEFTLIDFYPHAKEKINKHDLGTVKVYIKSLNMSLSGIRVQKRGKRLHFKPPHYTGWNYQEEKSISYPLVSFDDKSQVNNLIIFLHQTATKVVVDKFKKMFERDLDIIERVDPKDSQV